MEIAAFISLVASLAIFPIEEVSAVAGGRTLSFQLGALSVVLWTFAVVARKWKIRVNPASSAAAVVVLVYGLCSFFWAQDRDAVLSRAGSFMSMVLFFLVYQDLVATRTRLNWVALSFILACLGYAVWGFLTYASKGLERLTVSELQNPNIMANNLALAMMMSFILPIRNWFQRTLVTSGQAALAIGIMLTGSRGTLLSILLAAAGTLMLSKVGFAAKRKYILLLVAGSLLTYAVFSLNLVPVTEEVQRRVTGIIDIKTDQGGGRLGIVPVAAEMSKDHLILGVGWNNFASAMGDYLPLISFWKEYQYGIHPGLAAHNMYLSTVCELGLVGAFLLFGFLWLIYKDIMSVRGTGLGIIGLMMFLFICFGALKSDLLADKIFWNAMGFVSVIPRLAHERD